MTQIFRILAEHTYLSYSPTFGPLLSTKYVCCVTSQQHIRSSK